MVFLVQQPLDIMVFLANHWSDDGMVTNHQHGLTTPPPIPREKKLKPLTVTAVFLSLSYLSCIRWHISKKKFANFFFMFFRCCSCAKTATSHVPRHKSQWHDRSMAKFGSVSHPPLCLLSFSPSCRIVQDHTLNSEKCTKNLYFYNKRN